jgi:hypothetical protein
MRGCSIHREYDRQVPEPETEIVDATPVLHEPASSAVAQRSPAGEVAVQAAAVAGASFVAGAGIIALLRSRRARKNALKLLRGRRRNGRLEVLGTRSFLVDVHCVDRR